MADPIKDFHWGVLHVSGPGGGWSEKYALPQTGTNSAAAVLAFKPVIAARAACLADNFSIIWARVSRADAQRDAFRAISTPVLPGLQPRPDPAPALVASTCNNIEAALHFRFESAEGKWANRLFRGVRDDVIADGTLGQWSGFTPLAVDDANLQLTAMVGDPGVNTFITINPWKNLCQEIRKRTMIARPNVVVVNKRKTIDGYFLYAITDLAFRQVASKKTGRPFGQSPGRAKARV